ncbi:MAG: pilin [Candidatus Thiodiazotropha sp.]
MKQFIGRFLIGVGALVILWALLWLVGYFTERGFDREGLIASFTTEIGYWLPVLLLGMPGIILIHHGRRLLAQSRTSVLVVGEVAIIFAILGILVAFVFPMDNFSYVAATIVNDGMKASEPARKVVELHHARYAVFPSAADASAPELPAVILDRHIRSIALGQEGRIEVTYDTQDIDWGWSWWHGLLMIENNDLTGKTLVLVPAVLQDKVIWDECSEGTVPKRNRHFKCSGHK